MPGEAGATNASSTTALASEVFASRRDRREGGSSVTLFVSLDSNGEIVPWALGHGDPVQMRVAKRGEVDICRKALKRRSFWPSRVGDLSQTIGGT